MEKQNVKGFIADIIRRELADRNLTMRRMVLFGSQARGDFRLDSDWDFLVSIDKELGFWDKTKIITAIQRRLAQEHISVDVIIKTEDQVLREQANVGVITYYALKDGIPA